MARKRSKSPVVPRVKPQRAAPAAAQPPLLWADGCKMVLLIAVTAARLTASTVAVTESRLVSATGAAAVVVIITITIVQIIMMIVRVVGASASAQPAKNASVSSVFLMFVPSLSW